jgi:hypothetical protein
MIAGQMLLGIAIGFTLILIGFVAGAALGYGRGYDAGEQDASCPARHRKTAEPSPLGMSRLFEIPPAEDALTQVIDHHRDAPDVFAAVPVAEYDLLTRPAPAPDADSPSNWTRRQALEMDAWIKEHIVEPSNVTQHLIQAGQR